MATGVELISAERGRQQIVLGYDPAHDAEHEEGTLAFAAACYAAPDTIYLLRWDPGAVHWVEPWPNGWERKQRADDKVSVLRARELMKAGALAAAELDLLMAANPEIEIELEEWLADQDDDGA